MKTSSRSHAILRLAAAALGIVMIAVLVHVVRRDGPAALAAWREAHVRWSWVVFAVACALAGHAVYIFGWVRLLRDSGIRATFWPLARMFLVSCLGRYLPAGKAWQMAIVALIAAEERLPTVAVAGSSLFQGIVGVGVGALVLFVAGGAALGISPAWIILPIAGVVGLILSPSLMRAIPRVHSLISRRLPGLESITAATMWTLIWTSAGSWIGWGIALYGLGRALFSAPTAPISAYIAAWTGSFLSGLIAVVSPAGLGARESVMEVVLSRAGMAAGDVLVLVLVARAGATLLDIVPAAIALGWQRWSTGRNRSPSSAPAAAEGSS